MQRFVRPMLFAGVAAVVVYGVPVFLNDFSKVSEEALSFGLGAWLIVLALELLNLTVRFIRWDKYLGYLEFRVPVALNSAYYLAGFAFTLTPGKAGEAMRSLYLKKHQVPFTKSIAVLFVERFVDLIAMLMLAGAAAYAFESVRWPMAIVTVILLVSLPMIRNKRIRLWMIRAQRAMQPSRLRSGLRHLLSTHRESVDLLRAGPLYSGLTLGLIAWSIEGVCFYFIFYQLGAELPLLIAVGIYASSLLVGALTFLPGGLGSTEVVMGALLALAGVEPSTMIAGIIIYRFSTLWFAVGLGAACVGLLELRGAGMSANERQKS